MKIQRNRPFFAYIHTCEPHAPFEPPAPWDKHFDPEYTGNITGLRSGPHGFQKAEEPEDIAHEGALYDGEVSFADRKFGEFLDILESEELLDKTMIILIADHGEELQDHGDWNHSKTLYEEILRVPMIIGGDRRLPRGELRTARVGLVDVMPTVLSWAKAEIPDGSEGVDVIGLVDDEDSESGRVIFAENYEDIYEAVALVEGQRKLIYSFPPHREPEIELYDLASDPLEKSDLAEDSDAVNELLEKLLAYKSDKESLSRGEAAEKELDAESRERLRALGYID